jgi:hypothetical protein
VRVGILEGVAVSEGVGDCLPGIIVEVGLFATSDKATSEVLLVIGISTITVDVCINVS